MTDGVQYRQACGARSVLAAAFAFAVAASLQACGFDSATMPALDLSVPAVPIEHPLLADLRVREPLSTLELDSPRILVRSGPKSFAYFADAQWSDRLPALVQTRLVETFEKAKLFRAVSRDAPARPADYTLELEIRRFEFDATAGRAVVEMTAKITASSSGAIVASRTFKQSAASGATGSQAAAALDKALSTVMAEIVAFMPRRT
jgi:cholesterol transport system auxiliary component